MSLQLIFRAYRREGQRIILHEGSVVCDSDIHLPAPGLVKAKEQRVLWEYGYDHPGGCRHFKLYSA